MKFVSWNVNGLRAICGKGFAEQFAAFDADFVCLQETKLQEGQIDLSFDGYTSYWNYAQRKGYSGTVVFTRQKPAAVTYGIGIDEHDTEGRVITLDMGDYYLVNVYTPNSQDQLARLDYRMSWESAFADYLCGLAATKDAEDAASVREGMELIYNKLVKYLESNGVKAMDSTGKEFDPELHEAIASIPAPSDDLKGKVVDTTQKGYMINDKVLRHAKVAVGQ